MEDPAALSPLILLVGAVVVASTVVRAALNRIGAPALVGYLLLGLGLRLFNDHGFDFGAVGREVLGFLAIAGVIVLLFRVGLESKLTGLLDQLRSASVIWVGNVALSGLAGYVAARYLLSLELIPSVLVGVALTATSVGIPSEVWHEAQAIDTPAGQRFLDVAELDDITGIFMLALLAAVLPVLNEGGPAPQLATDLARQTGWLLLKLAGFVGVCLLFSRYGEQRCTRLFEGLHAAPDPVLPVVGMGFIIAAAAALLGFSAAIGAFFAGLAFSRDPDSVKFDASIGSLHALFTPFFFVNIGFSLDPAVLGSATTIGGLLLVAAVVGKLLGAGLPARLSVGWAGALILGVSMVPRAEICMLIMHRARAMGPWAAPPRVYAGMVVVCAITCVVAPWVLRPLLRRRNDAS